jgi:hypothetical protein
MLSGYSLVSSRTPITRYREVAAEFAMAMHQAQFQDVLGSRHPENPVQQWIKTISANLDRSSRPDFEHQEALAPFLEAFDSAVKKEPDDARASDDNPSETASTVAAFTLISQALSEVDEQETDEYRENLIYHSVYSLEKRMEAIRYERDHLDDAYHPLTARAASSLEYLRVHLSDDWCRRAAAQLAAAVPEDVLAKGLPDSEDPRQAWAAEIMRLASFDSLSLEHEDGEADNGEDVEEEQEI